MSLCPTCSVFALIPSEMANTAGRGSEADSCPALMWRQEFALVCNLDDVQRGVYGRGKSAFHFKVTEKSPWMTTVRRNSLVVGTVLELHFLSYCK